MIDRKMGTSISLVMTNESLNSDIIEFINDFTLGLAIPLTENTYEGDDRVKLLCVEKEL